MIKKTIKFVDYDGTEREEEFFFNLTKMEAYRLSLSKKGGFAGYVREAINRTDPEALFNLFEELIKLSYGQKSPDGRRFVKNEEIWNDFYQSQAYEIFMEKLLGDSKYAAEFFNGVMPDTNKLDQATINKIAAGDYKVLDQA